MNPPSSNKDDVIPQEVQWALQRADGFTDLKLYARAHESMASIPEGFRTSRPYQIQQLRLAMEEEAWASARELALILREALPEYAFIWIQLAYATRRSQGIREAETILVDASAVFPDQALIPYNLSCYASCQGKLRLAREYLGQALAMEDGLRAMAMEDEDLEPLWDDIETL